MALALDSERGRVTLQLARLLADPLAVLPAEGAPLPPLLSRPAFRHLAPRALEATPAGPLLAEIAEATRQLPPELGAAQRRALSLALAPAAALDRGRRLVAAAIYGPRLRVSLLRAERDQRAALFGPEAFEFALRESPLLAASLARFDDGATLEGDSLTDHPVTRRSDQVIAALLASLLPVAGLVHALRSQARPSAPLEAAPAAQDIKQGLRTLERGIPA